MRLYCDYNSATEDGRYWVLRDLEASGVELRVGMTVTLYMDDRDQNGEPVLLLVDAVIEKEGSHFVARADKRTWREEKLQGSAV